MIPNDQHIPALKSNDSLRSIMRAKALQASLHPDTFVAQLGDFIDILLDDVETLTTYARDCRPQEQS